jgi:hypothetical protein
MKTYPRQWVWNNRNVNNNYLTETNTSSGMYKQKLHTVHGDFWG